MYCGFLPVLSMEGASEVALEGEESIQIGALFVGTVILVVGTVTFHV